jgi:hypothetical protein
VRVLDSSVWSYTTAVGKLLISFQLNFRQNAIANDRLFLGGPRRLFNAQRCDERRDNSYQAGLHDVTSGNSASSANYSIA